MFNYKIVSITESRLRSKVKNDERNQLYYTILSITETKYKDLKLSVAYAEFFNGGGGGLVIIFYIHI